jgi:hypothetical protein
MAHGAVEVVAELCRLLGVPPGQNIDYTVPFLAADGREAKLSVQVDYKPLPRVSAAPVSYVDVSAPVYPSGFGALTFRYVDGRTPRTLYIEVPKSISLEALKSEIQGRLHTSDDVHIVHGGRELKESEVPMLFSSNKATILLKPKVVELGARTQSRRNSLSRSHKGRRSSRHSRKSRSRSRSRSRSGRKSRR